MLQQINSFFLVFPTCTIDWFLTFIILYVMLVDALYCNNRRMTSVLLLGALKCIAVKPRQSHCLFTFAPLPSNSCMTSVWLVIAARWSAVQPNSPTLSIGIPSSNKRTTLLTSPRHAARVNLSMSRKLISVEEINVQTKFFPFSETRLHHSLCSII